MSKFLKEDNNKFLKEEKEGKMVKNKFLTEDREDIQKEFTKDVTNAFTHFLMGSPEEAIKKLQELSESNKHMFQNRVLTEEIGENGFKKLHRTVNRTLARELKILVKKIDKFIP